MKGPLFAALNAEQARAVGHIEGPLLVFAGAGSGKTRVIVHRVAHLVDQGVDPRGILCLTFTNKAAGEMKERMRILLQTHDIGVWAGTFHSFGAWFLRREAQRIGYPQAFAIYDEADQRSLINRCIRELNIERERGRDGRLAWLISMSKDTLRPMDQIPVDLPFDPAPVAALYEQKKKASGAFDFADLICVPGSMLAAAPDLRERYHHRFTHILVDEYQDTNMAQYRLLMQLVGPGRNICVVGDDDQSIYGWRGADVGNILRFREDFPDASVVVLEQNYRSTEDILRAASSLISNNRNRAPKTLRSACGPGSDVCVMECRDDVEEARQIAFAVSRLIEDGAGPAQIAVFYRVNALSRVLEEAFVRQSIPYAVYGGMRFYERREVKDLLSYLRLVVNPADEEALARIINVPARGIGEKSMEALFNFARRQGMPTVSALEEALGHKVVKGAEARGIRTFVALMDDLMKAAARGDASDVLAMVVERSGYREYLLQEPDGEDRLLNVRELIASAEGATDLAEYLQEKALMTAVDAMGKETVSVMTLHMSKGLEFDYVFIAGCEEGLLPHARSFDEAKDIEEERRLLYVGITR
ncbi:MAG TPA: UvrD-helicase domain-containing protein, partial [Deltaproteobacteria bacterium]|nr:UvrD-helicase domain-containing protein [Deltaproteobacteria bacterium]